MGSSQYLYNAKMREEIAEQLGVTPTPGGLELLLRQSENNRMAHGGIMNMNKGGSALMNPFESNALTEFNRQVGNFDPYPADMKKPSYGGMTSQESSDSRAIADAIANRERLSEMARQAGLSGDYEGESTGDIVKSIFN